MMSRSLVAVFVVALGVGGAAGGTARADEKVDWSSYLEPAGSKGPAVKHDNLVPQPKAGAKTAKAPAATVAKAKAKPAPKAKRKTAARPSGH